MTITGNDGKKILHLAGYFILPMAEKCALGIVRKTKEHIAEHLVKVFGKPYPADSDYKGKEMYDKQFSPVLKEKWMRKDVEFFKAVMSSAPRWLFKHDYDPRKPFSKQIKIMEEAYIWTITEAIVTNIAKKIKEDKVQQSAGGVCKLKGGRDHAAKRVWVSDRVVGMFLINIDEVVLSRVRGGADASDRALIQV